MKKHMLKRLLSWVLVVVLCLGTVLPAAAADASGDYKVTYEKVDNDAVSVKPSGLEAVEETEQPSLYKDTETVRVSIVLSDESTIEKVGTTENLSANAEAKLYRGQLAAKQTARTNAISNAIGEKLDVVWNLTLAANIISANVEYGQIEDIEKVPGVEAVLIETRYEPAVVDTSLADDPNMATSSAQIGSSAAWAAGYTGAGSRIAVVDTGIDTDHQSFSAEGYAYSLSLNAEKAGMTVEEYTDSLKLLDADKVGAVWNELNAAKRGSYSAADTYVSSKIPFGFNYIDKGLDVTHDNDRQGEHGSHVEGIAAANAYIPDGAGSFTSALSSVQVQGVAPDAQILAMKVFGKKGGAYDSDYMAAIEDAIVLGADSVNLSLGAPNPGRTRHSEPKYQAIMESLAKSGTVVAMSAGNSGSWVENARNLGYLYADDVSMQTNGAPGSYANSLAVASVENDGYTGYYFTVDGKMVFYKETFGYYNNSMTTLAGEQEYILIEEYGQWWDWYALQNELQGKIAICSRGGGLDFSVKADNAVSYGAIATVIYNNEPGPAMGMDLSKYTKTAPCVSISQADSELLKAAATRVEHNGIVYYKGVMNVGYSIGSVAYDSEYQTMSSFSSWGVPSSLELKPEIAAPGGNIYSVNGAVKGGQAYESMSGTSMASPQVAGMAAVAAQYIRENGLAEKTGRSVRQLVQSLLMSTAVPLREGEHDGMYYPVLRQGAGMANVGAAVSADSYIWMDETAGASAADGKIKAELGDDPDRDGKYTVSFSIHNLTDDTLFYDLAADLFTQDVFTDEVNDNGDLGDYMATWTTPLNAIVTWTVDGKTVTPDGANLAKMDFNGDGKVNNDDCTALLEYVTGVRASISHAENADLDGDGDTDSYDAYLFLSRVNTGAVTVPANGSVHVTAVMELTEAQKAALDEKYPNGAYVEGYLFAKAIATVEGMEGTTHSIPVLGFYGNWSDPSMFDVGSRIAYAHGEEVRTPYLGAYNENTYVVQYAGDYGGYYFGGNPVLPDETYMPERNAINSENGDQIYSVTFTAIRSTGDSRYMAFNETANQVLDKVDYGAGDCAYYYVSGGVWMHTSWTIPLEFMPVGAAEGDRLRLDWSLAPDYYVDSEGNTDWDAMGKGTTLSIPMVVDNTAPELKRVSFNLMDNTLDVIASDNQYVAGAVLYNAKGTKELSAAGAKQDIQPGETAEYSLDLTDVNGKSFLLQVYDYAMNAATYQIEMQIGEELPLPEMFAYDLDKDFWFSFAPESTVGDLEAHTNTEESFYAATIADHVVFASTDQGDLYVMPEEYLGESDGFEELTLIGNMGMVLTDMAYNKADGKIYGVNEAGYLVTVDRLTGAAEEVGKIGIPTNTLACDSEGTFYCNYYQSKMLYRFTLDTVSTPRYFVSVNQLSRVPEFVQSMEINPNTGKLCWISYYATVYPDYKYGYSYYLEIDPATGSCVKYNNLWDEMTCLIIPEKSTVSDGGWAKPTDTVSGIQISQDAVAMYRGDSMQLSAAVQPWTASDRTVSWSTDNPAVAVVSDSGLVTAVSEGTCTVRATSNLDPAYAADCRVTVNTVDMTLKGVLQDADAQTKLFSWDMKRADTWTGGLALEDAVSLTSAAFDTRNGDLYVMDAVSKNWNMHKIDMETGKTVTYGDNTVGVPLWDMEYSQVFSTAAEPKIASIYYIYLLVPQDPMALETYVLDLSQSLLGVGANYVVAIASLGYEEILFQGKTYQTERFVLLDDAGYLWNYAVYEEDGGYSALRSVYTTNLNESPMGDGENMFCSMVVGEDGNLYLSVFDGAVSKLYLLTLDDDAAAAEASYIGDMGEDIWPAALYAVKQNDPADEGGAVRTVTNAEIVTSELVSASELAAAAGTLAQNRNISKDTSRLANNINGDADPAAESFGPVTGGLNAVVTTGKTPVRPLSDTDVTDNENTVTLHVTAKNAEGADVASHNGQLTVSYDSSVFDLASVQVRAAYSSYNDAAAGKVVIAYAGLNEIPAGEYVATLILTRKTAGAGSITIDHEQVNDLEPGYEEVVPINYPGEDVEDHDWSEWVVTTEPTCTEAGEETRTCKKCGETETREVAALGHDWSEWTVTTAPTCTEAGEETRTCVNCGETETREVAALGHDYQYVNQKLPTLTEPGYSGDLVCTRCGDVKETGHVIPATGTIIGVIGGSAPSVTKPTAPMPFTDVNIGDWFYNDVKYVYENGLMNGTSDTKFSPYSTLTRAMVVTVLYRIEGEPSTRYNGTFSDVADYQWYTSAVEWAAKNEIVTGYTTGKFGPNDAVTREQLAAILYRYAGCKGYDVTGSNSLSGCTDSASISAYAVSAAKWAVDGDMLLVTDGKLRPREAANRAEVAAAMASFYAAYVE